MSAKKTASTAMRTKAPMLPVSLPYFNSTSAKPTIAHTTQVPITIDQTVPKSWLNISLLLIVATTAAARVPPIQVGLPIQYQTAVTAPAMRPNASRGHAYGEPSIGKADPSSAVIRPLGNR